MKNFVCLYGRPRSLKSQGWLLSLLVLGAINGLDRADACCSVRRNVGSVTANAKKHLIYEKPASVHPLHNVHASALHIKHPHVLHAIHPLHSVAAQHLTPPTVSPIQPPVSTLPIAPIITPATTTPIAQIVTPVSPNVPEPGSFLIMALLGGAGIWFKKVRKVS